MMIRAAFASSLFFWTSLLAIVLAIGCGSDTPATDCPESPGCPQCANEADDDEDGVIDYPADTGCSSESDDDENNCTEEQDSIIALDRRVTQGTTADASDDFVPNCSLSTTPDVSHRLVVSGHLMSLTADTNGSQFDTVLTIRPLMCAGADLACNDDGGFDTQSRVQLDNVAPGEYAIIVDGFDNHSGAYTLNVHGVISGGEACDPALVATGLFSCESSYACMDNVCAPAACNNGQDDDMDGLIDVPEDPGCRDIDDGDEYDDCPAGPQCPACSNELDDDADGVTDFPADRGCTSPHDDDELDCDESDGIVSLKDPQVMGSTLGAVNDHMPMCSGSSVAGDIVHQLDVPGTLNYLSVDTFGSTYDTLLYARHSSCGDPDRACNDDTEGLQSAIVLSPVPPGSLYIIVDGFSMQEGNYTLNAFGEIAAGEPCDIARVTSGLLACAAGTTCVDLGAGFRCQ